MEIMPATTRASRDRSDRDRANEAASKTYEPVTYDGAGHGFMRARAKRQTPSDANKKVRDAAFQRTVELLKKI